MKIITSITFAEKEKYISLSSLVATYRTLLMIDSDDLDKTILRKEYAKAKHNLLQFWSSLASKYNFPLRLDLSMKVNTENNYIYMDNM